MRARHLNSVQFTESVLTPTLFFLSVSERECPIYTCPGAVTVLKGGKQKEKIFEKHKRGLEANWSKSIQNYISKDM